MTKTKFRNNWYNQIEEVEIIKESKHSVWLVGDCGCSARKDTHDRVYRDTPEEVFEWIKNTHKTIMDRKEQDFLQTKARYETILRNGIVICK